jgi:lipid-binding SYLF domain-containing protein
MYSVGGVSVGFQVGGSSSDFVLLLMNAKVVDNLLSGKTKMGTDATAAAGPGAPAASASDADILTYGKAKGVFAGVSLGGATVEPDNEANHRLYGKTLPATDIVRGARSSARAATTSTTERVFRYEPADPRYVCACAFPGS